MKILTIPNHPGFRATENGEIIGKRGKPLIGRIDRCGYHEVVLSECGKSKSYLVHRLVLSAFEPISNMDKYDVNHKDGNKQNNCVDNLEWCSRSENVKHAYETGLERKRCGEEHHAHKLTESDVQYIRKVYKKRDPVFGAVALSKKFGVDRTTIHDVIRCKTWRNAND